MLYVIGAIVVSLLFFVVGIMLVVYYFKKKINEDVLQLHDNFILTAVTYNKKLNGKLKIPGIFARRKTIIQYFIFTIISMISAIYFTVILFTNFINV